MLRSVLTIDLYAGAGGLSLGLQRAGFEVVTAVELNGDAAATYRELHPGVPVLEQDVRTIDFSQWRGQIDLICGGPPCQPFSSGGKRLSGLDPRDGLPTMLAAVRAVNPAAVLIENVAGLTTGSRRHYFIRLIADLERCGYIVSSWVLDAGRRAVHGLGGPRRRQPGAR
jgi:DNA (cytosine-5)-methyltransferase 1